MTLKDIQFNQAVTLIGDPDFLAYVTGRAPDDEHGRIVLILTISNPGKTGQSGCKPFRLDELAGCKSPCKKRGAQVR
jgi:hypothetical protein